MANSSLQSAGNAGPPGSFWAFHRWASGTRGRPHAGNGKGSTLVLAIIVAILLAAGSIPLLARGLGTSAPGGWAHHSTLPFRERAKELWWGLVGPIYDWRWSRVEAAKQQLPKYVLPPGLNRSLPV